MLSVKFYFTDNMCPSIIGYFGFSFTAAYNYIMFSFLRRSRPCWL